MNKCILIIVGLAFLASCEEELENSGLCNDEYFYYYGGDKIYSRHSLSEVWIEFEDDQITDESAEAILKNYPFLEPAQGGLSAHGLKAIINEECNCAEYKDYLATLNENDDLIATPVFYLGENDSSTYWILLNEVLTMPDTTKISRSKFIEHAGTFDLELRRSTKYGAYKFKFKDVKTGFESLEAANILFESGNVEYSHPNFLAEIVQF